MSKYPNTVKGSNFFKDGRLSTVSALGSVQEDGDQLWVLFGGCSDTQDCNEFLVLHKKDLLNDDNFIVVNEIM